MKVQQKLSDVIELFGGGTPKTTKLEYWNGNIPWLSVVDFNTGKKYIYRTEKTITEKGLEESSTQILQSGSIIISARGTVGAVGVLKKPMAFNQSCYGIRGICGLSYTDYIYYVLKYNLNEFLQQSHGGVFSTITRDTFKNIEIYLPPFPEQRAIAAVLSSLDDKIDLLNRQNATLEAMAEALFRQWFVVEAKEEWEEKTIGDVVEIKGGSTPSTKNSTYWNGNIPWTSPRDLTGEKSIFMLSTERTISAAGLAQISSGLLPKGTLLLSSRAPIGYLAITDIELAINQGYIAILNNSHISNYYMYLWCKYNMNEIKSAGNGSVFQEISKSVFRQLPFLLPPKNILSNFNSIIESYFQKIHSNQTQIRTLENLRDTLLPKLMSGEVRVAIN